MRFKSASARELQETAKNISHELTLCTPKNDVELDDEKYRILTERVVRMTSADGESTKLFNNISENTDKDGDEFLESFLIDIDVLWKLVYEHRRYEAARGFTDAEMQVLRAIEFDEAERVVIDEIMNSVHTEDLTESTIYKALRALRDDEEGKGLIERVQPGVYRYIGP